MTSTGIQKRVGYFKFGYLLHKVHSSVSQLLHSKTGEERGNCFFYYYYIITLSFSRKVAFELRHNEHRMQSNDKR